MTMTFSDKYDWRGSKSIAKLATAGYQIAPWRMLGGWGGIRTHGTLAGTPVFKTGAFNHSATHPDAQGSDQMRGALAECKRMFLILRGMPPCQLSQDLVHSHRRRSLAFTID